MLHLLGLIFAAVVFAWVFDDFLKSMKS